MVLPEFSKIEFEMVRIVEPPLPVPPAALGPSVWNVNVPVEALRVTVPAAIWIVPPLPLLPTFDDESVVAEL